MPASKGSSSFITRTYSKKSSAKRKQPLDATLNEEPAVLKLQPIKPIKRRKISVETSTDSASEEKEKPRASSTDIEQDEPSTGARRGSIQITYGSSKRIAKSPSPSPPHSPQKTPKLARDLSGIFQSITPTSSPLSSPTKLAKRMLARSKTDTFVEGQSSIGHFERTPSLPNLPISSQPKATLTFDSHDPPPPPPPVPLPVTTRTYAGKARSFLVALPASSLLGSNPLSGGLEGEDDEYSTRESYASLRTRWGVDNSEDDPYPPYPNASPLRPSATSTPTRTPTKSGKGKGKAIQLLNQVQVSLPNGMMNPLKSITELRSKGESRRFLDEVGYLFEGMDSSGGLGLRRASALEITTKLCNSEFSRKAKAADFLERIWDIFREAGAGRGEDQVLDTLLALFAALVSRDPTSLADLAQHVPSSSLTPLLDKQKTKAKSRPLSFVDTLFGLLTVSADPLALISSHKDKNEQDKELKRIGVGKKERGLFTTIHDMIVSNSSLFPIGTHISTSLLLTQALQALPPSLISMNHLSALINSLRGLFSLLLSSSSSSFAYLSWPDAVHIIPYEDVYNHLRLLDMYILGQWGRSPSPSSDHEEDGVQRKDSDKDTKEIDIARDGWLADGLIALCVCAEIKGGVSASKCMEIAFRVLVSLTHNDEEWGKKIVENECSLALVARIILSSGNRTMMGSKPGSGNGDDERGVKKESEDSEEEISGYNVAEGKETQALDKLCLALGLLTNLLQVVDSTKNLLRHICPDSSCTLKKRSCIQRCTCNSSKSSPSLLEILVHLYTRQLPPSQGIKAESTPPTDTADAFFLRGHLAVLLGLLMRGSGENQNQILAVLDRDGAGVNDRAKLNRLIEHAGEFIRFYAILNPDRIGQNKDGEDWVDGDMRPDEAQNTENKVAKDVVIFLEKLRDDTMV